MKESVLLALKMEGTHGKECRQPLGAEMTVSKEWGFESMSCKKLNSAQPFELARGL